SACKTEAAWASGFIKLLPFLEMPARYDGFMVDGASLFAAVWSLTEPTSNAALGPIPAFSCPSDPNHTSFLGDKKTAATNDVMCFGDSSTGTHIMGRSVRGAFSCGGFNYYYCTMASITDGLSNTVAFGESLVQQGYSDNRVGAGMVLLPAETASFINVPGVVLGHVQGKEILSASLDTTTGTFGRCGSFAIGAGLTIGFQTILPPNSPSATDGGNWARHDCASIMSSSSYHVGGVNVTLCDGSVRFINETINSLSSGLTWTTAKDPEGNKTLGPSPFGIWGALGSKDGGESAAF
ncbi:MAG: DUF1559 domain-containing protein, partial [Thermoguttaceae bacterium]